MHVIVLTKNGYEDKQKAVSALKLKDLQKGIIFKNHTDKKVLCLGFRGYYKSRVSMGIDFDDIEELFDTLAEIKTYISKNIKGN